MLDYGCSLLAIPSGAPPPCGAMPMTQVDLGPFLAVRRHLRIAHHIPGRIRLRAGPAIVKDLGAVNSKALDRILRALDGIKDVRVNPTAGSMVVEYRPDTIKPDWWETLILGPEASAVGLMHRLLENELASAVSAAEAAGISVPAPGGDS